MPNSKYTVKFNTELAGGFMDEATIKVTADQIKVLNESIADIEGTGLGSAGDFIKNMSSSFADFCKIEKFLKDPEVPENEGASWRGLRGSEMFVFYPRNAPGGPSQHTDHTIASAWMDFYNVRDLLARFFVSMHSARGKIANWREYCIGVTGLLPGRMHMPMLDYDGKNIKTRVKKDVKLLQKKFGLGDGTIYETKGGLHVYFFSDVLTTEDLFDMLDTVGVCRGFKHATKSKGYSVLRVSAKYTEFDILPYTVVVSPERTGARPGRKAAIIKELLRMGAECGTHFASLYPQWAYYTEDAAPWKPPAVKKRGRKVRKISKDDYYAKIGQYEKMQKKVTKKKKEAMEPGDKAFLNMLLKEEQEALVMKDKYNAKKKKGKAGGTYGYMTYGDPTATTTTADTSFNTWADTVIKDEV